METGLNIYYKERSREEGDVRTLLYTEPVITASCRLSDDVVVRVTFVQLLVLLQYTTEHQATCGVQNTGHRQNCLKTFVLEK